MEKSMYLCIFTVGFFFSSDIFSSLMQVVYPIKEECLVMDIHDLKERALPVLTDYSTYTYMFNSPVSRNYSKILKGQIVHQKIYNDVRCLLQMINFKNISCTFPNTYIPEAIKLSKLKQTETAIMRATPINLQIDPLIFHIQRHCYYYHRLSEIFWLFHEQGHYVWYHNYKMLNRLAKLLCANMPRIEKILDEQNDNASDEIVVLVSFVS